MIYETSSQNKNAAVFTARFRGTSMKFYHAARPYIPEDRHRRENIKPHAISTLFCVTLQKTLFYFTCNFIVDFNAY